MKYALAFTILFAASFLVAQDTLTLKDCDCHKYDNRFDLCSVTISKGQVFSHRSGYIVNEALSPFGFTSKEQGHYKSPYVPHGIATWSGLTSTYAFSFYTLLFFIENKRA